MKSCDKLKILKALANEYRFVAYEYICNKSKDGKTVTVNGVSMYVGTSPPYTSQYLTRLLKNGLVQKTKIGLEVHYSVGKNGVWEGDWVKD